MIIHQIKRRALANGNRLPARKRYFHCKDETRDFRTMCGRDTRHLYINLLNRDEFKLDDGQNCAICRFLLKRAVDKTGGACYS